MVDDPLIFCLPLVIGNKTSSGRYIEGLPTEVNKESSFSLRKKIKIYMSFDPSLEVHGVFKSKEIFVKDMKGLVLSDSG